MSGILPNVLNVAYKVAAVELLLGNLSRPVYFIPKKTWTESA